MCSGRSLAIRRASKRAMDLQGWLATVLLVLALVGCVEGATGLSQPRYAPDAPDNSRTVHDRGGDGAGSGMQRGGERSDLAGWPRVRDIRRSTAGAGSRADGTGAINRY